MKKISIVFGTRPEAIKLGPLILELKRRPEFDAQVCVTAQHREMLDQVLAVFGVRPDADLNLMTPGQALPELTARAVTALSRHLQAARPDRVLVQGDTTTTFCAALAAYYLRIPVAHVEAGLRTGDRYAPFPEEINRRLTTHLADLHFAPTEAARDHLLREGIPAGSVHVTGNTVIDALLWVRAKIRRTPPELPAGLAAALDGKRLVLVTGHRRESFGRPFEAICRAIADVAARFPDVAVVYPVHLNPNVQEPVRRILGGAERVHLVEPLPYEPFVALLDRAYLVLTDSGGVQEEAPSLGKPVLVMREVTERPEGIAAGCAELAGVTREGIVDSVTRLLTDAALYQRMSQAQNPYGDGQAALRIADLLSAWSPERSNVLSFQRSNKSLAL
jgi:UDP-N-acetylglucosamine 2-epimerase (non-hydrolysing)